MDATLFLELAKTSGPACLAVLLVAWWMDRRMVRLEDALLRLEDAVSVLEHSFHKVSRASRNRN